MLRERSNYGNPGSNYGFMANPPRKSLKRFQMHQGCVLFDSDSDGTIYFGLSAGMEEIWAIFHLCRWFETPAERWKIAYNSFNSADRSTNCSPLVSASKNTITKYPDVFQIISRIKVVIRWPNTVFYPY